MSRGNLLKAALLALALFLAPALFASANPCSTCFSTYIGISESNGTIEAVLFSLNQTVNVTQGMGYFDTQVKNFLGGAHVLQDQTGLPQGGSPVQINMSINPVYNASLWFTYYDRQGQQQNVSGCYPVQTNLSKTITYIDVSVDPPKEITTPFWYANCTIPYRLYNGSSVTIYIEFRGDQELKPTVQEIVIYDINAGGLNAIAQALQDRSIFDPTRGECLAGLIMFGLLLASMYYAGKSPLAYMDITVPRIPKPKNISFGSLIGGAGNVRLSMPSSWDQKYLDTLINRHAKFDFGGKLRRDIERMIERSNASIIQKYFAKAEAARGGNWAAIAKILTTDEKLLILDARNGMWNDIMRRKEFPHQLLMVMDQHVANEKVIQGMGTVGGDQPKIVSKFIGQVRKIPLIGTFIGIASGSFFYAMRTGRLMTEAAVSKPVRMAMEKTGSYSTMTAAQNAQKKAGVKVKPGNAGWLAWLTSPKRKMFEVASMTDPKKMNVGKLFQIQDYTKRFYEDARDSYYDELSMNIIWHEAVYQLRQKLGKKGADELIGAQADFKNLFKGSHTGEFIKYLESVGLSDDMIKVMRDVHRTPEERAHELMKLYQEWIDTRSARMTNEERLFHKQFMDELNSFRSDLDEINKDYGINKTKPDDYDSVQKRAQSLVEMVRRTHDIDKPVDLLPKIQNGEFFVLTGRNSFIYEEKGERRNFGFFGLALKEYIDQQQYLGFRMDQHKTGKLALPQGHETEILDKYSQFQVADAFKLAYLKIGSHVVGHSDWFSNDPADLVSAYDVATGKGKRMSFVRDVLNFNADDAKLFLGLMGSYLNAFLTGHGTDVLAGLGGPDKLTSLLYNVGMEKTREKEETTPNPLKRQQWYTMRSESIPEAENWRTNMNFAWTSLPGMGGQKATLFHEARGEKYWANRPRMEEAWSLIETHMSTRLAHMLNGTQWDFASGSFTRPDTFSRFSRVDMYKFFNETWDYYSKADEALKKFQGQSPDKGMKFEDFLKKDITYETLRNSKTPFIYTHDYSYLPYVKGMVVSDFDRIMNGIFVLQEEDKEKRRTFNFNKFGEYYNEISTNPKYAELSQALGSLGRLRKEPLKEDVESFSAIARGMGIDPAGIQTLDQLLARITGVKQAQKEELLRAWQRIDSGRQPVRALTHDEVDRIKNVLLGSEAPAEIKLTFLYQFSQTTHDWKSLWTDPDLKFFEVVSAKEWKGPTVGKFGELLGKVIGEKNVERLYGGLLNASYAAMGTLEPMIYASGKPMAEAMANNVAVSELYRERGHDMRIRVKSGGFLEDTGYKDYEKEVLNADYNAYANSFQRYFIGWMDSVTRDPRGSSTQWGRQWYLATLYHRGGAMHPESHEFGGERTFLSPLTWFFAQTFQRANTLNWMFASPFVRMMRGFQSATYGYPTLWDKNIGPGGDIDLMEPWPHVEYTSYQKLRALTNPAESSFTLGKFNPKFMLARTIHVTPGLNLLSYFFPSLDPAENGGQWGEYGKNINTKSWFSALSHIPIIGAYLNGSQAQRSGRAGRELAYAQLKQVPEDFLQYKGGQYSPYITDTANPGVSYIDYMGQGKMAARNARYLVSEMTGSDAGQTDLWRTYYASDAYVQRQSSFSMARRGIAADVKRLQFQQEFTGYGPIDNPMWAPLSWPTAAYWGGKWLGESKLSIGLTSLLAYTAGGPLGWSVPAAQSAYQAYHGIKGRRGRAGASVQEDIASGQMPNFAEAGATRGEKGALQKLGSIFKNQYAKFQTDVHTCMYCNAGHVRRGGFCPKCGMASG
ncbi:MAG: hypothetical protein PHS02_02840 [Candidatus ainarchaeum sp.]|nr:hypothetical protein [Candidatus ainarchaeum sp.]